MRRDVIDHKTYFLVTYGSDRSPGRKFVAGKREKGNERTNDGQT